MKKPRDAASAAETFGKTMAPDDPAETTPPAETSSEPAAETAADSDAPAPVDETAAPAVDAEADPAQGRPEVLGKEQRELPVKLSDAEVAAKARELSEVIEEIEEEEKDQAEQKAAMKARMGELEAKQRALARVVRRGTEDRMVDVWTVADYESGNARAVRQDTGEVLSSRVLSNAERQLPLDQVLPFARVENAMAVHSEAPEAEKK